MAGPAKLPLMSRNGAPLAALLCTGLLLSLVGPRPASLQRVPARPAGAPLHAAPALPFRWPLDGAHRVVRRFDPPAQPWLAGHRGVDLAGAPGATVRAAGAGRIRFAGRVAGRPVVSIDHAGGLRTTYEPVEPLVRAGDAVAAGDPVGRLLGGHPKCLVPACLHWGLRRDDLYLDPLTLFGLGQVRLLPLA